MRGPRIRGGSGYLMRVEQAAAARADRATRQPCPNRCGHPVSVHLTQPPTLDAIQVPAGCGQPHTGRTGVRDCAGCAAAVNRGEAWALTTVPNPNYQGAGWWHCQTAGCTCRYHKE
jgi:hypothetical protein